MTALLSVGLISAVALYALPAGAQSPPSPTAATTTPGPSNTPTQPPASSPTPPPAGTPWPAPTDLRVTTQSQLLDEDGLPLPPERQEHTDVLTWHHVPGLDGEYEVEVTLVPFSGGSPTVLEPYMRFPTDRGAGTIGRVSQYPEWLNNQRCYRIRTTVPSGTGGIETGPFSASVCTVKPPSTGPSGPTPAAPDAGTGAGAPASTAWPLALGGVLIAFAAGSIATVGLWGRSR